MKILTSLMSCAAYNDRLQACQDTWLQDIQTPHDYFVAGEAAQVSCFDKVLDCTHPAGEQYELLLYKIYNALKYAVTQDFDFWHKCDDDVYVHYDKLIALLKTYQDVPKLYLGRLLWAGFPFPQYACGMSYILSRKAVFTLLDELETNIDTTTGLYLNDWVEDRCVGKIMTQAGIPLVSRPDQFLPASHKQQKKEYNQSRADALIVRKGMLALFYDDIPYWLKKVHAEKHPNAT